LWHWPTKEIVMLREILQAIVRSGNTSRLSRSLRSRRRNAALQLVDLLESRLLLAGTYSLLKDVATSPETAGSNPRQIVDVGGTAFFVADTLTDGKELWKSDGTASGTTMVKNIFPGVKNGAAVGDGYAANVNGTLFFVGDDGTTGYELWKTDGTEAGTVLVKDIDAGTAGSSPISMANVNGTLYFTAETETEGRELWKSDGTAVGTVLVKDIRTGVSGSYARYMTDVSGTLFFTAFDGVNGKELWKSDGTAAGTTLVKDVRTGSSSAYPQEFTNVAGTLFFGAFDGTNYALWKSDGTTAGTVEVAVGNSSAAEFTAMGTTLFFSFDDGANGQELWKSDGTLATTVMVKDIAAGSGSSYANDLVQVGTTLFFTADDGTNGFELWKSDGTAGGTVMVKDVNPGANGSGAYLKTNVGGTLFFQADDGTNGYELWKSDGTSAGTVLVKDINSGAGYSYSYGFTNVGGTLFFSADDMSVGYELWKSDGTAAGTTLIKDIQTGNADGDVGTLIDLGGTLLFTGDDGTDSTVLFKSGGTAAGTVVVRNFGVTGNLTELTEAGGTVFFAATDNGDSELWKTDGTTAGTVLVKDINVGSSSSPRFLTNVGGTLYFRAFESTGGSELWKSDGTAAGTVQVKDIRTGSASSSPYNFAASGGTLFFAAGDGVNGTELWKSDGTDAGTVLVKDIRAGATSGYPFELTDVSGTLFFRANDGTAGSELWKSDGTAAGTVQVKDVFAGAGNSFPRDLTDVGGTLFFTASDGVNYGLWKSDGTTAGTVLVKTGNQRADEFTAVGNTLFFAFDDLTNGYELWKSDGTNAGTVMVKEIRSGVGGGYPRYLTNIGGVLYFNANDGIDGERLWTSDGTAAGTMAFTPGASQPTAINPRDFVKSGSNVLFDAVSAGQGRELFIVDSAATDPPASAPFIAAPATSTTEQRPTISWTSVADATEYEIWIKNQSTGVNPFYQATVAGTSHVPTVDLGIGRFNMWIRAKNSVGNGPWTAQYNFTINTRATVNDPGRFLPTHKPTLTWPALPGAVKYDLWIDDKLGGVSQFIRDQNVTGTSWTPSSDMPIGLYHAWIRGVAADGASGGWSVTTIFYVMPSPNVTQGLNPTFDRTPTFAWDTLTGAVKYEIFFRDRNTGATALYEQNIAALNFTPATDLPDGLYRVWIIGVSAANVRSFWTDPIDIHVGGRSDVLAPSNGSTVGANPTFMWRTVDDGSGGTVTYNLWVDRVGVQTGYINVTGLTTTSYTHGTALPTGLYRAWVQTVSSTNEKIWSLVSEFTVAAVEPSAEDVERLLDPEAVLVNRLSEPRHAADTDAVVARRRAAEPVVEIDAVNDTNTVIVPSPADAAVVASIEEASAYAASQRAWADDPNQQWIDSI
jgi:ELWxxDGT repeat protein